MQDRLSKVLMTLVVLILATGLVSSYLLKTALDPVDPERIPVDDFYSTNATASDYSAIAPQPCINQFPHKKAWFGALHVHTAASYDAYAFGVTNTASQAYAFGRGETLQLRLRGDTAETNVPEMTIARPLDFMAVTDHAQNLGEQRVCHNPQLDGYSSLICRVYRGDIRLPLEDVMQPLVRLASMAIFGQDQSLGICGPDATDCLVEARNAWQENQEATEQWLDSSENCEFTTFHGYEYTLAKEGSNLHRNVIFSSNVVPPAVVSARDKGTPEALWQWLQQRCIESGEDCDVLTIPHNSNWSSGRMWYPYSLREDLSPEQQRNYAQLRARLEPLTEIMQVKGDSECRNGLPSVLGAADEFCDFEKLRAPSEPIVDCGNVTGSGNMRLVGCLSRFSYARYALSEGLAEQQKLGVNPFKMGIVAATDNHNGTADADRERNYLGSSGSDRTAQNRLRGTVEVPGGIAKGSPVRYNPGGLAGVWAPENSRTALFTAMQNRETFGTSGPRIEPRFFGGYNLDSSLCNSEDMLAQAYASATPMGGDLPADTAAGSPSFLVSASQDPNSQPLQRIQIIKGWVDRDGQTQQAVFDVAGEPDNGADVNLETCETQGGGFAQLCSVWSDPDFDAGQSAVYYTRVLENPSCRWSTWQCNELPEEQRPGSCNDPDVPKTIQERAWTSPIWYNGPAGT